MMKRVVIVLASAISSLAMGVGGCPGGAWAVQAQSPLGDQALGSCLTWGESPLDRASVLGSPRRPVNGVAEAGVVLITPRAGEGGTPMTLSSSMLGLPDQRRGWFGAAVAAMDMTSGDECDDLVIGMPGASGGRGAVAVVPDFGNGLEPSAAVWLPTAGLALQPGDRLGAAITARSRLIVAGAPGRDAPGARDAGALVTWWVLRDATVASRVVGVAAPVTFVQGSGGVLGHADPRDRFGSVLWSDFVDERLTVVVGVPDEDIGRHRDAGAVALLEFDYPDAATTLDNNYLLWQGSGLPGRSRSGDRLGAAVWYSDLRGAFGVPGKDANGRKDSGAIIVSDGSTPLLDRTYMTVTQDTAGVPDKSERGDRFGSALARSEWLLPDRAESVVAVGAPGEDGGRRRNAGAVTYLGFRNGQLDRDLFELQRITGLASGDRFGSRIAEMTVFGGVQILIGAPGEDRPGASNAGRYYVISPHSLARPTASVLVDGAVRNERLGG